MTGTTKPLSKREREALEEFRNRRDGFVCKWKPKTMEQLTARGLVWQALDWHGKPGYAITPAGQAALEETT